MGAKTWMLVYADLDARPILCAQPELDRDATFQLAKDLFASERLEELGDGDLSFTSPPDDELHVGCFGGVSVVAAKEFGVDHPSTLPKSFLEAGRTGKIYLHAMHSVVDWFAFALALEILAIGRNLVALNEFDRQTSKPGSPAVKSDRKRFNLTTRWAL